MQIAAGLSSYPGSNQNGITTSSWGAWSRSFLFASDIAFRPPPAAPPNATASTPTPNPEAAAIAQWLGQAGLLHFSSAETEGRGDGSGIRTRTESTSTIDATNPCEWVIDHDAAHSTWYRHGRGLTEQYTESSPQVYNSNRDSDTISFEMGLTTIFIQAPCTYADSHYHWDSTCSSRILLTDHLDRSSLIETSLDESRLTDLVDAVARLNTLCGASSPRPF